MSAPAPFTLAGYNPDVLTCIANLSNDEVFTPPEFANRMLDTLELAWAEANDGKSIWSDPKITFLDPFTKSGAFLREITRRLTVGLAEQFPDLEERVDHILTKQVYGIGVTRLTSLLARRSVYCSKYANGPHSVAKSFATEDGNIWFERTEHTWEGGHLGDMLDADGEPLLIGRRCRYCSAQEVKFDRDSELETHAYAFIHTDNITTRIGELFGADMKFDVVIGNPPYQMAGAAGGSSDASIYHLFVQQAQRLQPGFLSMVIPARWMAGGRRMTEFRAAMLEDQHLRTLVDYPLATDIFPSNGADFEGGACYFLWSESYEGPCLVRTVRGSITSESERVLSEFDVFVRDSLATSILHKVLAHGGEPITAMLARDTPFGIATNFTDFHAHRRSGDLPLYYTRQGKRNVGYLAADRVAKNTHLIDTWKVLVPEAYGERGAVPAQVLGWPWIAPSPSVCTQSFLFLHVGSEDEARSVQSYYCTKFFRFLVSLRKITQHALHSTYTWVPTQAWDRTWSDAELYLKYGITADEQDYIESLVKPMELGDE